MRRILSRAIISIAIALAPLTSAHAASDTGGQFIFRHKIPISESTVVAPEQKDITAFYVAGVGYDFSAKLPMKPQWQDDTWSVVGGELPSGVTFDSETLTFSGKPSAEEIGVVAELAGIDENGEQVATATATFDVRTIVGQPRAVDIYAHTNKYKFHQLDLPAGITVDKWTRYYSTPPGVEIIGRNFDGTPTQAGEYPVLITGENFMGETVITYFGRYIVEDGPTFPLIADDVRLLPKEVGTFFNLGAPSKNKVNYAIEDDTKVRYFLEVAPDNALPGDVTSNDISSNLVVQGLVADPYQTATVRYKAIDVDDTVGYSNWFEFGTSDPQPGCGAGTGWPITWYTNKTIRTKVPTPVGGQGKVEYTVISGELPELISLNRDTGYYEGKPMTAAALRDVVVRIDVINPEATHSIECKYLIEVKNSSLTLSDATFRQDRHIRVGEDYNGKLKVTGGIAPWSVTLNDGETLLPTLSFQPSDLTVSGTVTDQTLPYQVGFKVNNGDGNSSVGKLEIHAHGPLSVADVPTLQMKRYDNTFAHVFEYDANTVIPDLTTGAVQPTFTLSGNIPDTLTVAGDQLVGGITWPVGTYGPYTVTMSDYSGDQVVSKPFNIEVTERDPMVGDKASDISFVVEKPISQSDTPFSVTQPALATELPITWTISGDEPLPTWLTLDQNTGVLTAAAGIPYADMGKHGPYTVTATDSDGYSASSTPIYVKATDWPAPFISLPGTAVHTNVTGDVASGEDPVFFPGPVPVPLKGTFIDDVVTYIATTPVQPAGLDFDISTGQLSGTPTSEFSGPVEISFKDGRDRPATGTFYLEVHPYPRLSVQSSYDLPRIAQAANYGIVPTKNSGFWGSKTLWALAPGSAQLPDGLSVDEKTGNITGQTSVAEGAYPGIIVQATDNGSHITAVSAPFTINVVPRIPLEVTYENRVTFKLNDSDTGNYTPNSSDASQFPAVPSGSYALPLQYQIVGSDPATLSGVDINPSNGILKGSPATLGEWTVTVRATDADGATADTQVVVKSTLAGFIEPVAGNQYPFVRLGETFQTAPLRVKNYVGTPVFSSTPALLPSGLTFSAATGEFYGRIDKTTNFQIGARDSDDRPLSSPFTVLPTLVGPLKIAAMPTSEFTARQYSANDAIDISFPPIQNPIGRVTWSITGDLPGTLVNRLYDSQDNFLAYSFDDGGTKVTTTDASSLPLDALVFDTLTPRLSGIPSRSGTFDGLVVTANDDHASAYVDMSDPTRVAYNEISTSPFTITVDSALPLAIAASENPKGVVVPGGNANLATSADNAAYGQMKTWSVTGASSLPQGITYSIGSTGVTFSGYSEELGSHTVTVHGVDAIGRTASLDIVFKVLLTTDPIELTVSDIVTKPGFGFETAAPTTDNIFGAVRFYSNDINTNYAQNMTLASASGVITGTFDAVNDFYFDLYVTDATNRVTSKPVHVQVIPYLRIVAPTIVTVTQGEQANVSTDTDYAIGNVAYRKGSGEWPAGLDVDANTGAIVGLTTAEYGTYSNFTIIGVDALGDEQTSNVFSIKVAKKKALPTIANITDKSLTQNTAMTAITPVVTNGSTGDVYSVVGTLPAGVSINTATGVISGTPTEYGTFPIQIRVRDVNGDGADTNIFSLKVTPASALAFDTSIVKTHTLQTTVSTNVALPVLNAVGKVTYARTAGTLTAYTINSDGTVTLGPSATTVSSGTLTIRATDELSRTASIVFTVSVVEFALTTTDVQVFTDTANTGLAVASTANAVGSVTYTMEGLPDGLTYNSSTGTVSGTTHAAEGPAAVTVTAVDNTTGATDTASFTVMVVAKGGGSAFRYWRIDADPNGTTSYVSEIGVFKTYVGTASAVAVTNPSPSTTTINNPHYMIDKSGSNRASLAVICPSSGCDGTEEVSFTLDFGATGANLKSFVVSDTGSSGVWNSRLFGGIVKNAGFLPNDRIRISKSNNGVDWTVVPASYEATSSNCSGGGCGGTTTVRLNY
ncbi:putative Ig domain-containing protein [Pararhizobium sp. BT-229]|uniref:putative Ig domain-containing protein n=1 Tax=Pararhizobium sp. BT-229 TaxID=2986923 RepID=UPI0021F70649|nr:putative Ig domain-containing protein [Pararhizobium sp. BT-229]MCV9964469.1 putative Ig domain-containing protein [Pararhizobium sp. BT-229]